MFHIGFLENVHLLQWFHIKHPNQAKGNTFNPGWMMHAAPCTSPLYGFYSHGPQGFLGRGDEVVCECVCVPLYACVVKAERKHRVEKAHIKPSTVYLRSQALFGFKRNNKQMYTWSRKIITGVQGPQFCAILQCRQTERHTDLMHFNQVSPRLNSNVTQWSLSLRPVFWIHPKRPDRRVHTLGKWCPATWGVIRALCLKIKFDLWT